MVVYDEVHAERAGPRGAGGEGVIRPGGDHVERRKIGQPSAAEERARRARGERRV